MATIAFFPEGAFGPTNNCVGIGDVLRKRGHDVVFIIEESFAGNLEAKGFEERLMRLVAEQVQLDVELHPVHAAPRTRPAPLGLPRVPQRQRRAVEVVDVFDVLIERIKILCVLVARARPRRDAGSVHAGARASR